MASFRHGFSMSRVARFLFGRLAAAVIVLALISFLAFMAMALLPGDPASAVLGRASPERLEVFRTEHGFDPSALDQFADWASGAVKGDLGQSISSDESVWSLIEPRLRNSVILGSIAGTIIVALGVVVGTVAGARVDKRFDHVTGVASVGLVAVPEFAMGTVLAYLLGVRWDLFPAVALFPLEEGPLSRPGTLVLPVATLVLINVGYIVRLVRANVAEALRSPFVTQARLNGEPERYVLWRVALPAAVASTLQASALMFVYLIGGLIVVEAVFQYQGIGLLGIGAALSRDFTLTQGVTVVTTLIYLLVMLAVEACVTLLTPRLRTAA